MSFYGTTPNGYSVLPGQVVVFRAKPAAADVDGVALAAACSATKAITIPCNFYLDCPRQVTATAGGTATDIKAVKATVYGVDPKGNEISEDLGAFTADTAGSVTSTKSFAYVEKVIVPAMDGAGATVSVGWGTKLWLPFLASDKLSIIDSWFDGSAESSNATFSADASDINKSYVLPDSHASYDGKKEFVARFTSD